MSFGSVGGAQETLAYMIKAYDTATPVFKAFGSSVDAVTKQVQASLAEMNKALADQAKAMSDMSAEERASLAQIDEGWAKAADAAVASAAKQAEAAKEAAAATKEAADAASLAADKQVEAAAKTEAAFGASGSSLSKFGRDVLLGTAAAGAGFLDLQAKFQANTLRMSTQAGLTASQLDQVRQGLLKMSGEVGSTPDQLADGMYHVVSSMNQVLPAGNKINQMLGIMKVAAEGAQVGHSNLEDTTYALSSALNALHLQGSSAAKVMGELNAIVGSGDMTMQDLLDAFKSGLIPAANSFGLSLQSVGSALSVMGDMGMRGALAGTRLRMAISLLGAPTKEAAGILETLGLSSKDAIASTSKMSDLLQQAGVSITSLSADLRKPDGLKVALSDLDDHLKSSGLSAEGAGAAISRAFGGGRMGAAIMLLAENTDRLGLKFDYIGEKSNTFGQDWATTQETFRVQLDKALAALEAFGTEIGEKLVPYATEALHGLEDMATWFGKNKVALDLLAASVVAFSSVAIGSYLVSKLKSALNLMKEFGSGVAGMGRWLAGGSFSGASAESPAGNMQNSIISGSKTGAEMMQAAITDSMNTSAATIKEAMGTTAVHGNPLTGATGSQVGMIVGYQGNTVRVGSSINPIAVMLVSGLAGGESTAESDAAAGAATGSSGVAKTGDQVAMESAQKEQLEASTKASNAISSDYVNSAGRYYNPKSLGGSGGYITEGQATTLTAMQNTPAGVASVREAGAEEARTATLASTPVPYQATRADLSRFSPYGGVLPPETYIMPDGSYGTAAEAEAAQRASVAEAQIAQARMPQVTQEPSLFSQPAMLPEEELGGMGQLSLLGSTITPAAVAEEEKTQMSLMERLRGAPGAIAGVAGDAKGFLSGAGTSLMRGGMIAGLGVMGSQMAGSMIGGKAGSDVSTIGTDASLAAAVGSFVGPEGTLAGGVLGALVGAFQSFMGSDASKYGDEIASKFTAGLPAAVASHYTSGIADSLNKAKSSTSNELMRVVQRRAVQTPSLGRAGAIGGVHDAGAADPSAQALQQAQLNYAKAGAQSGQAFVAAWKTVQFPDSTVMFRDLEERLKALPTQSRAAAAATMVSYAQGLSEQGKLPATQVGKMIISLEDQFPQLGTYLENQSVTIGGHVVSLGSSISTSLQTTLENARTEFGAFGVSTNLTMTNLNTSISSAMDTLKTDMTSKSTQTRQAATEQYQLLESQVNQSFSAMTKEVVTQQNTLQSAIGQGSQKAAQIAGTNFANLAQNVYSAMNAGVLSTSKGVTAIQQDVNSALKAFGGKPIPLSALIASEGAQPTVSNAGAGHHGLATGGRVPGAVGGDNWTLLDPSGRPAAKVGGGELLIGNRHTEADISRATIAMYNKTAGQMVTGEHRQHSTPGYATGGALGYTPTTFASAVLSGLGIGSTQQAVSDMVAWEAQEGGNWNNSAQFNPLNTTLNEPGAGNTGTQGNIKSYATWAQGVQATVSTLRSYTGILNALRQSAPLAEFEATVNASPWGTHFGGTLGSPIGGGTSAMGATFTPISAPKVTGGGAISSTAQAALGKLTTQANQYLATMTGSTAGGSSANISMLAGGRFVSSSTDPKGAPAGLKLLVNMANAISSHDYPYLWGGGHNDTFSPPYDCSGSVSAVLHAAGLLSAPLTSSGFATYGDQGPGKYVTLYDNPGVHVFMSIDGNYFGTSTAENPGGGANWMPVKPESMPVTRHPAGYTTGGIINQQTPGAKVDWAGVPAGLKSDWLHRVAHNPYAELPGMARGGKLGFAGGFAQGGAFTAHGPTLGLFGEGGVPETVTATRGAFGGLWGVRGSQDHVGTAGNPLGIVMADVAGPSSTTTSSSSSSGAHSSSQTNRSTSGGTTTTQRTGSSTTATGKTTTTSSTTVTTKAVAPVTRTTELNPLTDRIESHTSQEWALIHAEHSKQVHDATVAKEKYDKWLSETITVQLTSPGSGQLASIQLTRKEANTAHIPFGPGDKSKLSLASGAIPGVSDLGFGKIQTGLKKALGTDTLDQILAVARALTQDLAKGPDRGLVKHQGALEGHIKTLHTKSDKLSDKADKRSSQADRLHDKGMKEHGSQRKTTMDQAHADAMAAARDRAKATGDRSDANKLAKQLVDVQTKIANSRPAQLANTAIAAGLSSVTSQFNDQSGQFNDETNIAQLLTGVASGTSLKKLGLTPAMLKAAGLTKASAKSLIGAGTGSAVYAQQVGQLQDQEIPKFQEDSKKFQAQYQDALKTHNTKLQNALMKQIDAVTQATIKAYDDLQTAQTNMVEQQYQTAVTQAQSQQSGSDLLTAVQGLTPGTNLASIGLGSDVLNAASTGITPAILQAAGLGGMSTNSAMTALEGSSTDYLSQLEQQQGGTLTPAQLTAAQQGTAIQNALLASQRQTDIGALGSLQGELPTLTGTAKTTAQTHILDLTNSILSLTNSIDANTTSVDSLTSATNNSTTSTGQMTGTVAYAYQGQDYLAGLGLSSEQLANLSVGG